MGTGNRGVNEAGISPTLTKLMVYMSPDNYNTDRCHSSKRRKKKEKKNRSHASPQKRQAGREGFLEEVWCKLKSNGKVEARQQACF